MHFKIAQPELAITSEDLKVVELAGQPSKTFAHKNAVSQLPGRWAHD